MFVIIKQKYFSLLKTIFMIFFKRVTLNLWSSHQVTAISQRKNGTVTSSPLIKVFLLPFEGKEECR